MIVDNKYLWKRALSAKVPPTEVPAEVPSEASRTTSTSETQTETPARDSETQTTGLDPSPELEQELNRTKASLQRCTEAKTRCEDASRDLVSDKDNLNINNKNLQKEIDLEKKKNEDLLSKLSEVEMISDTFATILEEEENKTNDFATKLAEEKRISEELARKNDVLVAEKDVLESKIKDIEKTLTEVRTADEGELNDLRAEISAKQEEINKLEALNADTNNQNTSIQEELRGMRTRLQEAMSKIKSLDDEVAEEKRISEELARKNSVIVAEKDVLESKIKDIEKTLTEVRTGDDTQLRNLRDDIETKNEKINELEALNADTNNQNMSIQEELLGMRTRLEEAMSKIGNLEAEVADEKRISEELARKNDVLVAEKDVLESNIKGIEKTLTEVRTADEGELNDLRAEISAKQEEINKLESLNVRMNGQNESIQEELLGMRTRLDEAMSKIGSLETEVNSKRSRIVMLRRDLRLSERGMGNLIRELNILQRRGPNARLDVEDSVATRDAGTNTADTDPMSDESVNRFSQEIDEAIDNIPTSIDPVNETIEDRVIGNLGNEYDLLVEGVRQEIDRLETDRGSLTDKELEELKLAMEDDIRAIEDEKIRSVEPLSAMRDRISNLYERYHRARVDEKEKLLVDLEKSRTEFGDISERKVRELEETFGVEVSRLKRIISSLEKRNVAMERSVANVTGKKNAKIEKLEATLAGKNAELEAAGKAFAQKEAELKAAGKALAQKNAELNVTLAQKNAELEAARESFAQKEAELEAAGKALAQKNAELEAAGKALAQKNAELKAALAGKKAELEAARESFAQKEAELEAAREAFAQKEAELEAAFAQKEAELNVELAGKDAELEAAREAFAQKNAELEAAREAFARKEVALNTAGEELGKWRNFAIRLQEKMVQIMETSITDDNEQSQIDALFTFLDDSATFRTSALEFVNNVRKGLGIPEVDPRSVDPRSIFQSGDIVRRITDLKRREAELSELKQSIAKNFNEFVEAAQRTGNDSFVDTVEKLGTRIRELGLQNNSLSNLVKDITLNSAELSTKSGEKIEEYEEQIRILERMNGILEDNIGSSGVEAVENLVNLHKKLTDLLEGVDGDDIEAKVTNLKTENMEAKNALLDILRERRTQDGGEDEDGGRLATLATLVNRLNDKLEQVVNDMGDTSGIHAGLLQKLVEQVTTLKENVDDLEENVDDLEEESDRLKDESDILNGRINGLRNLTQSEVDDIDEKIKGIRSEISTKKAEISTKKAEISERLSDMDSSEGGDDTRVSMVEMESQLNEMTDKLYDLLRERFTRTPIDPVVHRNLTDMVDRLQISIGHNDFFDRMSGLYDLILSHFYNEGGHVLNENPDTYKDLRRSKRTLLWTIKYFYNQFINWIEIWKNLRNSSADTVNLYHEDQTRPEPSVINSQGIMEKIGNSKEFLLRTLYILSPDMNMVPSITEVPQLLKPLTDDGDRPRSFLEWKTILSRPVPVESTDPGDSPLTQPNIPRPVLSEAIRPVKRRRNENQSISIPSRNNLPDIRLTEVNKKLDGSKLSIDDYRRYLKRPIAQLDFANIDNFDSQEHTSNLTNKNIRLGAGIVALTGEGDEFKIAPASSLFKGSPEKPRRPWKVFVWNNEGRSVSEGTRASIGDLVSSDQIAHVPGSVTEVSLYDTNVIPEYNRVMLEISNEPRVRRSTDPNDDFEKLMSGGGRERLIYLIIIFFGIHTVDSNGNLVQLVPPSLGIPVSSNLLEAVSSIFPWFQL